MGAGPSHRRLRGGARRPARSIVRYIDANKEAHGVEPICRELQIASQTFYAAKSRPVSTMALRHEEMEPKIVDT